jgi:hypothetical protein
MSGARMRKLTPPQEDAVRALAATVSYRVLAARYGVCRRTIVRTIARSPIDVVVVEIAGYYAQFEVREDGPYQRTGWRAVSRIGTAA